MSKITLTAEMFGRLLTKAGAEVAKEFKALTEGEADAELTQEQFDKVASGLLSIQDAIKHPEVIKGTKAGIFGPTEEAMTTMLKENGLDDAAVKALLDGKSNADKVKAALAHVKSLVDSDKSKTKEQREKEWQEEKAKYEKQVQELTQNWNSEKEGRELDRTLSSFDSFVSNKENFPLIDGIPLQTQLRLIREDAMRVAKEKGAKLVATSEGLRLMDAEDPTKPYHAPGSTEPAKVKEFFFPVIESLGFINKQPGETKTDTLPVPGNPVSTQVVAATSANHNMIENALKLEQV